MKTCRNALILSVVLSACAPAHKMVVLKADSRLQGGNEAVAKLEAPGDWYGGKPRADRADLGAPDNFSSISFSIVPVLADMSQCPEFAKRAAATQAGAAGPAAHPEFAVSPNDPAVVDYRMTIPALPSGNFNRYVQGRAMCRDGALALVTCSTGVERQSTTGELCQKVLESLTIEALSPVPARAAPTPMPAAPAPAPAQ